MVPGGCPLVTADFTAGQGQVKFSAPGAECHRLRGFSLSLPPRV